MSDHDIDSALVGNVMNAYFRDGRETYRAWLIETDTRILLYDTTTIPPPKLPGGCDFSAIAREYQAEKN